MCIRDRGSPWATSRHRRFRGKTVPVLYDTTATTHLGAIRRNLERIRARVTADRPDRRVLLAVKADAYGHGAAAVATMAQATGCLLYTSRCV